MLLSYNMFNMNSYLIFTGVAKGSIFSDRAVKFLYRFPSDMGIRLDNHLGDPVAIVDGEIIFTEIDEYDSYLPPVVGIDSAR